MMTEHMNSLNSELEKLSSEKERNEKLLRMNKDKLKTLEKKQELLTKSGRNKFIFFLGLIAEKYLIPQFIIRQKRYPRKIKYVIAQVE